MLMIHNVNKPPATEATMIAVFTVAELLVSFTVTFTDWLIILKVIFTDWLVIVAEGKINWQVDWILVTVVVRIISMLM